MRIKQKNISDFLVISLSLFAPFLASLAETRTKACVVHPQPHLKSKEDKGYLNRYMEEYDG